MRSIAIYIVSTFEITLIMYCMLQFFVALEFESLINFVLSINVRILYVK